FRGGAQPPPRGRGPGLRAVPGAIQAARRRRPTGQPVDPGHSQRSESSIRRRLSRSPRCATRTVRVPLAEGRRGASRVERGAEFFVGLYVVATVFFVPGSVLTLGAGAVLGVALRSVCVSVGARLGGAAGFLVGRYLARDAISRKIEKREKFVTIDRAVADEG